VKLVVQGLLGGVYRNAAGYHLSVVVPCPHGVHLDFEPPEFAIEFDDDDAGRAMGLFAAEDLDNCWPIDAPRSTSAPPREGT
jgi:hypothetical protein